MSPAPRGETAYGAQGIRQTDLQAGTRVDRPHKLSLGGREFTLPGARIGEEVVIRQTSFIRLLHAKRMGHESRFHLVITKSSQSELIGKHVASFDEAIETSNRPERRASAIEADCSLAEEATYERAVEFEKPLT